MHLGKIKTRVSSLDFHDIEREAPGLVAPNEDHIVSALSDAAGIALHRSILVHCHAGVSRSSAMALVLATACHMQAGEAAERAVLLGATQIRNAAPFARPNMRIVEIGSRHLGLGKTDFLERAWDFHRTTS